MKGVWCFFSARLRRSMSWGRYYGRDSVPSEEQESCTPPQLRLHTPTATADNYSQLLLMLACRPRVTTCSALVFVEVMIQKTLLHSGYIIS